MVSVHKVGIHLLLFVFGGSGAKGSVSLFSNFGKHHRGSMLTETENLDLYPGFLISFVTRYTFSKFYTSHFLFLIFIYLFIYSRVGSSFLC